MSDEYISCPFCGGKDFDEVGLKIHLTRGHCDVFEEVSTEIPTTMPITTEKETDDGD
jgi:hypothetical protein